MNPFIEFTNPMSIIIRFVNIKGFLVHIIYLINILQI